MKIYPKNIEDKTDFGQIREALMSACVSASGKEEVGRMEYMTDYALICRCLDETREMLDILRDASLIIPRGEIADLREALARTRIEGLYMEEAELHEMRKTLLYAAEAERFFKSLDGQRFPILSQSHAEGDRAGTEKAVKIIDKVIDKYGTLADNASPALSEIRRSLQQAQNSVSRAMAAIVRKAQAEGLLDKDTAPTLREGRLVLPIAPAYKRKIGGIVHDESASGKTIYIEPQQVVDANNRIRELEGEERRERIRILREVTAQIHEYSSDIMYTQQWLGHIDFVRSKGELGKELNGIVPETTDKAQIDWKEARHPILYSRFKREGKTVVPLTIRLTDKNILIISGPNAGGKSVCLKTVALIQYMLQCGLPVPMREDSVAGIFTKMMLDIGDEQSIEDDLSTYSSHLRNMRVFLQQADERSLILIDEFGSGTEPMIGGAIAEAILEELAASGTKGVITTHYTNLKHFAERTDKVVNGAMLYDRGQMKPLFQLSIGQAGSSFAIEIAKQTGLPSSIINQVKELVGEEHIDYERHLQDIARDKRYWEKKRQNIREREKHLEEKIAYYETEICSLKAKRKEVLSKAEDEAAELLRQSNATIERTIREIKEAQAEKNKTQQARAKVDSLKEKIEKRKEKGGYKQENGTKSPKSGSKRNGTEGKKQEANAKKKVLHDFSELKQLNKESKGNKSAVVNTIRQHKLHFERTLDLRGMRIDEAQEAMIAYIDEAVMVNAGEITIIHGTGTGAVKQVVRDYLNDYNKGLRRRGMAELEYGDGDINRGGAGLTIVKI